MKSRSFTKLICAALLLPVEGSLHGITLEAVLDQTLKNNPTIIQAKLNLEQAAGHRLVLNSITWPSLKVAVPIGIRDGHGPDEGFKAYAFATGSLTQPLFNLAIPPSRRLGDVNVLIARQQLNVAVVEQLHEARLAFYSAIYNRQLKTVRLEQKTQLEQNATTQRDRYREGLADRAAFASATVEAGELPAQVETAQRALDEARLKLAASMGNLGSDVVMPEPEGELQVSPMKIDLSSETKIALEKRADLRLARLMVKAATEQQRIIEAAYFPMAVGNVSAEYVPVTGLHREGTTRRTEDLTSEVQIGAGYTWRVIDNGAVGGALLKQRSVREINELTCQKLEKDVVAELVKIRDGLAAAEAAEKTLSEALASAEKNVATVQQSLASGLVSQLDYRAAQNAFLQVKSGLLTAAYQENAARAEWDRATGRYFQFAENSRSKVN